MKTLLKILGALVLIIIALAILLPIIFKGKIVEIAKEEINNNVNAQVDFTDFSLSLFRSFPNFNLSIEGILVIGLDKFSEDTLAQIPSVEVTIDLMSVLGGDTYEIKRIGIYGPTINVKILEDGSANYDIAMAGEETAPEPPTEVEGDPVVLTLKKLEIKNGNITYDDKSLGVYVEVFGLDHTLNGDLSEDFTVLKTNSIIKEFSLDYEGFRYISRATVYYMADIDADLKNEIYTLKKNRMELNQLPVEFDGTFSIINEDYNIVMTYQSPETDFKHFLSLIPAVYTKDFESIETAGNLAFSGNVKGLYSDNSMPSYEVNLTISDGMFKYPDLPQAVTNVNIISKIHSKDGEPDNTIIDVSKFHLDLGMNPVDMYLHVETPVSDPDISAKFKGTLNLADVQNFYPLEEGEKLNGTLVGDFSLIGRLSDIENENYDNFTALGSLLLKSLEYQSAYVKDAIAISTAQLNFSPQYLDLVSFNMMIGRNDFSAKGKIENYLAYALKDEMLAGQLVTTSSYFNLTDLMPSESKESTSVEQTTDSIPMSVIEIPANIHFEMTSSFDILIYDNIEMKNVNGKIQIADQAVYLKNLGMNILDGEMVMSGSYTAIDPQKPVFDFTLDLKEVDIQKAYNTFGVVTKYAPIAKKTSGVFSTKMNLKSILNQEMMPVYETMTGGGELLTSQVTIQDVNTLNTISNVLKMDEIKRMVIDKILFQFEFVDGKLLVDPFDIRFSDFAANLGGWTAMDQTIGYVMNMSIPRDKFGGGANQVLDNLVNQANAKGAKFSLGEKVSMNVLIGGTLSNPEIKTALKESGKNLVADVKEQVKQEIEKKKEEISQEAREQAQRILDEADQQSKKIINEAEKQATNVRKGADDAAKKIREEAEKQAKKVEEDGKKKGFLAEMAAKETAIKIRQEADKQAINLVKEADDNAKGIVRKANDEAALIKRNASKEADKILERN
ncbi:MAG: hypothetical protein K9G76_02390 [Bacteroidales bacterium]|nr:hypothetical protein [Bacteroidales bacterium]MCF8404148.1 hypothetical protein [Bacteroidales bacterium]